jgi:hypothetical protein
MLIRAVLRLFLTTSFKILLTAASLPDYRTEKFRISNPNLTRKIWNGTKVKRQ